MMITQKDWLMRQIENICRIIAKLLFNKQSPRYEIIDFLSENDFSREEIESGLREVQKMFGITLFN